MELHIMKIAFNSQNALSWAYVLILVSSLSVFGCGAPEPPEISEDVAEQIAAEDQQVHDAESEL